MRVRQSRPVAIQQMAVQQLRVAARWVAIGRICVAVKIKWIENLIWWLLVNLFTLLVTRWRFLGCKCFGRPSTPPHSLICPCCAPMFRLRLASGSKFGRVTTKWESSRHCA
jgi:hypothetical protein